MSSTGCVSTREILSTLGSRTPTDGSTRRTSTMASRSPTDGYTRRTSTPTKTVDRDAPVEVATKGSIAEPLPSSTSAQSLCRRSRPPLLGGWDHSGALDLTPRMSLFAAMERNQKNYTPRRRKVSVNFEEKALLVAICKFPPRQETTLRRPAPPRYIQCNSSKVIPTLGERVRKLLEANAQRARQPTPAPAYAHEAAPPCLFPGLSSKVALTLMDRVHKLRAGNALRELEPTSSAECQHDAACWYCPPLLSPGSPGLRPMQARRLMLEPAPEPEYQHDAACWHCPSLLSPHTPSLRLMRLSSITEKTEKDEFERRTILGRNVFRDRSV